MWEDPIVTEVHRIREQLAAEHNFDIAAFFADVRARQEALGSRLVKQLKRSVNTANVAGERNANSAESASSETTPTA